jgi:hypothetical protein
LAGDFEAAGLDIRPVSDPTAITKMQSLAKAQFAMQFLGRGLNDQAIIRRALEAGDVPEIDELMQPPPPAPPPPGTLEGMAVKLEGESAKAAKARAEAGLTVAKAAELATRLRMDDPNDPLGSPPGAPVPFQGAFDGPGGVV